MKPRKTHKTVEGRSLQVNKRFSSLKQSQQIKINQWMFEEYRRLAIICGAPPDARCNDEILGAVYEKIQAAEIWIPFDEVKRHFVGQKSRFRKRLEKEQAGNVPAAGETP